MKLGLLIPGGLVMAVALFAAAILVSGPTMASGLAGEPPQVTVTHGTEAAFAISLSPTGGAPGSKVMVTGTGFVPFASLQLAFDATQIGQATADGTGAFTATITVPFAASSGDHVIVATDPASGQTANQTFTVRTDWPMLGRDRGRTSFNRLESELGRGALRELAPRLSPPPGAVPLVGSPAVAGGMIYAGDTGGTMRALGSDGTELWNVPLGGPIFSSPAVDTGAQDGGPCLVFVGADDGKLTALNCPDGTTHWSFATGGPVRSSPLLNHPGLPGAPCGVFVGSDDGNVYALNCRTGQQVWSFHTGGAVESSPAALMKAAVTNINANLLVVQSTDGRAYGLNLGTGSLLWTFPTGGGVGSPATVMLSAADGCRPTCGRAFLGSSSGTVFALDARTGAPAWTFATGAPISGSPAIAPLDVPGLCSKCTAVFIGNEAGSFFAFEAVSGRLLWRTELEARVRSAPAVANGLVWVHVDAIVRAGPEELTGKLLSLDDGTGAVVNSQDLAGEGVGAPFDNSPVIADGVVTVGSESFAPISLFSDWPMIRHDPANTGYNNWEKLLSISNVPLLSIEWTSSDPALIATPAVVKGTAYFHAADKLTALDVATQSILWQTSVPGGGTVPAIGGGRVFINSRGTAFAFPAQCANGCKPLWQKPLFRQTDVPWILKSPVVQGAAVYYCGSGPGEVFSLVALNVADGSQKFRIDVSGPEGGPIGSGPTVGDGLAFFNWDGLSGNGVMAVDSNGVHVWTNAGPISPWDFTMIHSASTHLLSVSNFDTSTLAYATSCPDPCSPTWEAGWWFEPPPTVSTGQSVLIGSTLNLIQRQGGQHWLAGKDAATGQDLTNSAHLTCTEGPDGTAGDCGAFVSGANGLVFVGSMQDASGPIEALTAYQAGNDGVSRLYVGPPDYLALSSIVVAAGRVFVPACFSSGSGQCVADTARLMVYSVPK